MLRARLEKAISKNTPLAHAIISYTKENNFFKKLHYFNITLNLIHEGADLLHPSVEEAFFQHSGRNDLTIELNKMADTHIGVCLLFGRNALKTKRLDQLYKAENYFFKAIKIINNHPSIVTHETTNAFLALATREKNTLDLSELTQQLELLTKQRSREAELYLAFLKNTNVLKLHSAIEQDDEKQIEQLLNHGTLPDWNAVSTSFSPLHMAVRKNRPSVVKLLRINGADATIPDCKNETPVTLAASLGHWDCVEAIIFRSTNCQDNAYYTKALKTAIQTQQPLRLIKKLLDANAYTHTPVYWQIPEHTLLHIAAAQNNIALMRLLLLYGANRNILDEAKQTPGDIAQAMNHSEANAVLSTLPQPCFELNYEYFLHEESKALNAAIYEEKLDEVAALITPQNINQPADTVFQLSWLHVAVIHMQPATVKLLLENKAEPDAMDAINFQTPLALAMNRYHDLKKEDHFSIMVQLIPHSDVTHSSVLYAFHQLMKDIKTIKKFAELAETDTRINWLFLREVWNVDETAPTELQFFRDSAFTIAEISTSFTIPYDQLNFGTVVGSGVCGEVYSGHWNNQPVAIKLFLDPDNDLTKKDFARERKIAALLSQLQLPNVVKYHGSFEHNHRYGIVMQFLPHSLHEYSFQHPELNHTTRYKIMRDITYSLKNLHGLGILHRDLKRGNVLLDEKLDATLCDFGFATVANTAGYSAYDRIQGSHEAPEVLVGDNTHTEKSDVFALGCLLWGIFSNKNFSRSATDCKVTHQWIIEGGRPSIPSNCPGRLTDLIKRCWDDSQVLRPTAAEALDELDEISKLSPH